MPLLNDAGVNLSLLSRVMPSRLSRGTYNGGLLSTEAGTLARVIADGTITLAGYWGVSRLLNITLLPSLFICIASIVATCLTYNSLYWLLDFLSGIHPLLPMYQWCMWSKLASWNILYNLMPSEMQREYSYLVYLYVELTMWTSRSYRAYQSKYCSTSL